MNAAVRLAGTHYQHYWPSNTDVLTLMHSRFSTSVFGASDLSSGDSGYWNGLVDIGNAQKWQTRWLDIIVLNIAIWWPCRVSLLDRMKDLVSFPMRPHLFLIKAMFDSCAEHFPSRTVRSSAVRIYLGCPVASRVVSLDTSSRCRSIVQVVVPALK